MEALDSQIRAQTPQQDEQISFLKAVPTCPTIFSFVFFNLASYTVLTGPALILMLRMWQASAFQIGILLSMMPATQLIQLFIAPYVERVGIRKFLIFGLSGRNAFNVLVAILPFCVGYFGNTSSLYLLLAVMFFVDMTHSVGYAGWMTWVTWLVPQSHRGRYFSIEQLMLTAGQTIISFSSGFILGKMPVNEKFGLFLAIGAAMGWLSIAFLSRIPSPPRPDNPPKPEMFWHWVIPVLRIPAFRKMMYVCISTTFFITLSNFTVLFMTENLKITQDFVFYMGGVGTLASALSVYFWGLLADKFGSKSVMALAQRLVFCASVYWLAVALGLPYHSLTIIMAVGVVLTIGLVGYVVTVFRYVVGSLPREYMVFGTVVFNLTVQISASIGPLIWGRVLDVLDKVDFHAGPLHIHRFVPIYLGMLIFAVLSNFFVWLLPVTEKSISPVAVALHGMAEAWMLIRKHRKKRTSV